MLEKSAPSPSNRVDTILDIVGEFVPGDLNDQGSYGGVTGAARIK